MLSLSSISDRPNLERLRCFLDALLAARGGDVALVVLFGSMARGDFGLWSDYDVLVGLRRAEPDFLVRLGEMRSFCRGGVDVFPYTLEELSEMERSYHLTLLEALDHGLVLLDDGTFADMRRRHAARRAASAVERCPAGWRRDPARDPFGAAKNRTH